MATITPNDAAAAYRQEVHDRAVAALQGKVDPKVIESTAGTLADHAYQVYQHEIAVGHGVDQARIQGDGQYNFELANYTPAGGKGGSFAQPAGVPSSGVTGSSVVTDQDIGKAIDQYRTGIDKANDIYGQILSGQSGVTSPPGSAGGAPAPAAPTFTKAAGTSALSSAIQQATGGPLGPVTKFVPTTPAPAPGITTALSSFKPIQAQNVTAAQVATPKNVTPTLATTPGAITTRDATAAGPIQTREASAAGAIPVQQVTPAERLAAARQDATTVGATSFDTSQSDESRAQQQQNLQNLQATAQGQGAGQIAANARLQAAQAKLGQSFNAQARAERGVNRKGALRAAQLAAAEGGANALVSERATEGQEQQQAQGAISQTLQATRSTDVDVAAKKAQIDQTRQTLQAQLDAARAANDQNAINTINAKLLDLDQQAKALNATQANSAAEAAAGRATTVGLANAAAANAAQEGAAGRATTVDLANAGATNAAQEAGAGRAATLGQFNAGQVNDIANKNVDRTVQTGEFNAGQTNTTAVGNADRTERVGEANNTQGLAAQKTGSDEALQEEQLKVQVAKAAQDAAQGLLSEKQREAALQIAQQQMALAQQKGDRDAQTYWFDKISAFLTTAGAVGAALSDRRAKLRIARVSGADAKELAGAIRESLSTYDYKPGLGAPEGPQLGVMAQALRATRLGKLVTGERPDGLLTVDYPKAAAILAAFNLKTAKERA